jgi:hypothetical protein
MGLLPALLPAFALTTTGAPLPFPRTPSALTPLQGDWAVSEMSVDAAGSLTGLPSRLVCRQSSIDGLYVSLFAG